MWKGISIARKILWGVAVIASIAFVAGVVWTWQGKGSVPGELKEKLLEGLKVYRTVPDFTLVERSGRKVTLGDLRGKVWVAQCFYSECRDICPLIVPQMGLLRLEYKTDPEFRSDIRFVSITVDPGRDTPQVLAKFADRLSADAELWLFLTGDKRAIYRLAQEGFGVGIGEQENPPDVKEKTGEEKELFHGGRLIIVDRKARVRGYYSGLEADAMVRLRRDLKELLQSEEGVS